MKILITESQKEQMALKWMNMKYSPDQLEVVTLEKYPDSIFYRKKGKVVMRQDLKTKIFLISYNDIWSFLTHTFSMSTLEIRQLMKTWLDETLNLKGYTPLNPVEEV